MTFRPVILLSIGSLLTSACTLGPDYSLPDFSFSSLYQQDEQTKMHFPTTEVQQQWWKSFNDETLNQLIAQATENNHDLRIAIANVDEAKALRGNAKRALFPSFSLDGDASKTKSSKKVSNSSNSGGGESDRFTVEGGVLWETDVFGRLKRSLEAETARLEAEEATKHGVMLSVISEVARNYFEVRGLQKRIEVTTHNIEVLREVEHLAKARLKSGVGTNLDISQAKGERQSFESRLPNLRAEMKAGIFRLSVLSGKTPEHYLELLSKTKPMPNVPDIIPVGLRSDILKNRPDIAVAERELAAATADIGTAIAERYPDISLTGAVGSSARLFGDLFTSGAGTFSLGSSLSWRLFDGGHIVEARKASQRAAIATYEKTILNALEEVEASLIRYGSEWQTLKALEAAKKTRQEGFRIAKLRYKEGEEDFLSILDSERSLVLAEDAVIQSEIALLTHLTTLYKALGGGWQMSGDESVNTNEKLEKVKDK